MRVRDLWPLAPIAAWLLLVALVPALRVPSARVTGGTVAPLAWLGLGAQIFAVLVWWWAGRTEAIGRLEAGLVRAVVLAVAVAFWVLGLRAI